MSLFQNTGETVRVVAMEKDFHVDCYVCELCEMQLTDEPDKRCYPLDDHLFCKQCHIRQLGGLTPQNFEVRELWTIFSDVNDKKWWIWCFRRTKIFSAAQYSNRFVNNISNYIQISQTSKKMNDFVWCVIVGLFRYLCYLLYNFIYNYCLVSVYLSFLVWTGFILVLVDKVLHELQ